MSLCFENSFYPGYVTEKLIHALLSGGKSIYWGGLVDEEFINHPNLISLHSNMDANLIASQIKKDIISSGKIEVPPCLLRSNIILDLMIFKILKNISYLFS